MSENEIWTYQLDWLNILHLLGLKSINQIPEFKKQKAFRRLTKLYGTEVLLTLKPKELDELVADELRESMKKELMVKSKRENRMRKEYQSQMGILKKGRIIGINMSDLKDLDLDADPEEIFKFLSKKFLKKDDDDKDEDKNNIDEDKTFYYI